MDQLAINYRPLEELKPFAHNARKHPDAQVAELAAKMEEVGFLVPILVDASGEIMAGHGRMLAARRLGLEEVPTISVEHLTDEQKRAFILADNRIAENAEWDQDMLAVELADLSALGVDIDGLGFKAAEIADLFAEPPQPANEQEEATPEVEETEVSRPGDLWQLGKHRLLCGDSTCKEDVDRVLAGLSPVVMVTDPPYGVNYDPEWRNKVKRPNGKKIGAKSTGLVQNDHIVNWEDALALFPGPVMYIWHADKMVADVVQMITGVGFEIRAQIIWKKSRFVISRGHYHPCHEPCLYAVRKGSPANWRGNRKQSTVWEVSGAGVGEGDADEKTIHSTQKPVEVMRRPIMNHTRPGDVCYEPFMGSGTSIIAAESANRICAGIEIDPRYIDVAVRRWQKFTGNTALLEGDGRPFQAIEEERNKRQKSKGRGDGKKKGPPHGTTRQADKT